MPALPAVLSNTDSAAAGTLGLLRVRLFLTEPILAILLDSIISNHLSDSYLLLALLCYHYYYKRLLDL